MVFPYSSEAKPVSGDIKKQGITIGSSHLLTAKASFIPFSWSPSYMSLGMSLWDGFVGIIRMFYGRVLLCFHVFPVLSCGILWPMPFLNGRAVDNVAARLWDCNLSGQHRFGFPHISQVKAMVSCVFCSLWSIPKSCFLWCIYVPLQSELGVVTHFVWFVWTCLNHLHLIPRCLGLSNLFCPTRFRMVIPDKYIYIYTYNIYIQNIYNMYIYIYIHKIYTIYWIDIVT